MYQTTFSLLSAYEIKLTSIKKPTVQAAPVKAPTAMKAPRFLSTPRDQTINEGVPAKIVVEVEADPMPRIVW